MKAANYLKNKYWNLRADANAFGRKIKMQQGMLENGILPGSHAADCIWQWERYFSWLRLQARRSGYTVANRENLVGYKKSDILFVLGSGPSVNSIDDTEWQSIKEHDSIGFNYFLAHPFVPTYYHMELLHKDMEMFRGCYSQRREAYQGVPFMVNYHFFKEELLREDVEFIENKFITVPRFYTDARPEDVEKIFHFLHDYVAPGDDYFMLHYRGSLCLMISLGVLLGYKKIVLVGIDLNNSGYFFCDDRYAGTATQALRDRRCKVNAEVLAATHATADPAFIPNTITIDRVLRLLDESLLKKRGVRLFVYSNKSLLYPAFPAWDDHDPESTERFDHDR